MIIIPILPFSSIFDTQSFWQGIASTASTLAMWAQHKAQQPEEDPLEALTYRLRKPLAGC